MPGLDIRWEQDQCVNGHSQFATDIGAVRLCGTDGNPDHKDEWAQTHESFHWYQYMFMPALTGNDELDTHPQAGSFGDAFASVMPHIVTGHRYVIWKTQSVLQAEDLDFNGNLVEDFDG